MSGIYYHESHSFEGMVWESVLSYRGALIHATMLDLSNWGNF